MAYDDNDLVNYDTNLASGSTLTAAQVSKRKGNKLPSRFTGMYGVSSP